MTAVAGSFFDLWNLPTLSLSCLVESEREEASILRTVSRVALYFQPSLTRQCLEWELDSRGDSGGEVISSLTLRVVDAAYYKLLQAQGMSPRSTPIYPEDLTAIIASAEEIDTDPTYRLLEASLDRVLESYSLIDRVIERTQTVFDASDLESQAQLRELFQRLKPEHELEGLVTRQWVELGFQGSSPKTDFRRLGSLALDSMLYFARTHEHRAVEITDEAVNGGTRWYPLALAMIHMTAFALDMAISRDLQLLLLRSYQTRREPSISSAPDLSPFLSLASELLLLFHQHWFQGGYTVMQFEQVAKEFQQALRPWVRRGVLDGRALGWNTGGQIKLE